MAILWYCDDTTFESVADHRETAVWFPSRAPADSQGRLALQPSCACLIRRRTNCSIPAEPVIRSARQAGRGEKPDRCRTTQSVGPLDYLLREFATNLRKPPQGAGAGAGVPEY